MAKSTRNRVRIIGGRWRSRLLSFPGEDMLRPTPDRVRETLFNWLQGKLRGRRCLDCYAGSGALGFEALSRGADTAVFVESSVPLVRQLKDNVALFEASAYVVQAHFPVLPEGLRLEPFGLVFLDPPFGEGLVVKGLSWLLSQGMLASDALVYVETELAEGDVAWPQGYHVLKSGRAGRVFYYLLGLD
jgi:16S rRNA (guanine966-N2)-methyltransferase